MKDFLISLLLICICTTGVAVAADDPMISLFKFQQKMANSGSAAAMIKLGRMYEYGHGTKQDFNKATSLYQKAKAKGHPDADAAIKNLISRQKENTKAAQRKRDAKVKARQRAVAEARQRAKKQAAAKQLAKEKAAREKAAREKAARDKAARDKAARDKARKAALAQKKAAEKAKHDSSAREKVRQETLRKQAAINKRKAVNKKAQQTEEKKKEGFKSDPCRGAAARVMSICKGK